MAVKHYRTVKRKLIEREEDIPDWSRMTREEEADWWDTHELADHLWESGPEVEAEIRKLARPRKQKTSKRLSISEQS